MEISNKKAYFEYNILDKFEAGIKLTGEEIKSVRLGMMNIDNSYIIIRNNIPYLLNSFINKYANRYSFNEKDERRDRELLLNKHEILKLSQKVKEKGLTIVCTKAYFKGNLLKIEIALARGKNLHDKRETIKKRDIERGMEHDIRRIY